MNIPHSLPDAHDVALGVLLEVGLHHPGRVLPVGHDAAGGEEGGVRAWAVGLPGDRDTEHLHLGEPLSESTTTRHPLPHRVAGSTTMWVTASSSQGAPPITAPSLSPSHPFLTVLPVRGLGHRLGRVDLSC